MCGVKVLVTAALCNAIVTAADGSGKATAPDEIVYIPEGINTITPFVDGKPKKITVRMDPSKGVAVAAAFQEALDRRNVEAAANQNTNPWFDFNHKKEASSAEPTGFRYEPGKGVMAQVIWSSDGRAAVEGRTLRYFSPNFFMDDEGSPAALPERGPLGGLVPEPAFRTIGAIAAADGAEDTHSNHPHHEHTMKSLAEYFKLDPARTDLETQLLQRVTASDATTQTKIEDLTAQITALTTERDKLKEDLGAADGKLEEVAKKRAEDLVTAAIADGRIAPKDDKTKALFLRLITAGDADAEGSLAALQKKAPGIDKLVSAKDGKGTENKGADEPKGLSAVEAALAEEFAAKA